MIQIAACGSGVIALCIGVTGLMELAAGGSLEDALKAMAFTAASFGTWHVVGTALSAAQQAYHLTASAFFVLKTSVHGVVGGALSLAQGGSFIDGFVSNAVGAAAGLGSEGIFGAAGTGGSQGFFGRTAVAAIAGGTASELTGGKFANGALTAAFAQMWNAEGKLFGQEEDIQVIDIDPGRIELRDVDGNRIGGGGFSKSAAQGILKLLKLRGAQMLAKRISDGHAFQKHVLEKGEFPGVRTRQDFERVIQDVIVSPTSSRELAGGRIAYWKNGVVVIYNPRASDFGTAFVPRNGINYFQNELR